jgi:hypothetical protein
MSDKTRQWWSDILSDLEPDTTTFTLTMSRTMVEETLTALTITDEMVEDGAIAVADEWGHTWDQLDTESQEAASHLALAVLEAALVAALTKEEGRDVLPRPDGEHGLRLRMVPARSILG